jgi:prepilin-type N-terminal cleavage/methylation domain-containing protein
VNRRGFSLVELMIVVVMMGIMTGIGYPRLRDQLARADLRAAAARVAAVYAQGRANAIQTGRTTTLNATGNRVWLTTVVAGVLDTVGTVQHLDSMYKSTLTAGVATVDIDPRGIVNIGADDTLTVARGSYSKLVIIGRYGRIETP